MARLLVALFIALPLAITGDAGLGKLKNFKQTNQSEQSGTVALAPDLIINAANDPFTFSKAGKIRKITRITFSADLFDTDTGPGAFEEDSLFLELDGINTGISLNAFGPDETATVSGAPINKGALLQALKADKEWVASIFDVDNDGPNGVTAVAGFDATLVLKGKVKK